MIEKKNGLVAEWINWLISELVPSSFSSLQKPFRSDCSVCTFYSLFPALNCAERVQKNHNGWREASKSFVFFLHTYSCCRVTFQSALMTLTCIPSHWARIFLCLPHLILLQDWKANISAMQITVSCACRSTFQRGAWPSAAGSRERTGEKHVKAARSSNFLLLASHKGCFVERPLFQSASYDYGTVDFMFSFKIGHLSVYFREARRCLSAENTFAHFLLFFSFLFFFAELTGMQRVLSHKAIKSPGRAECSLKPHSAVAHTQTRQTKWSCECSLAWNHGCFLGQRRLLWVPLPLEWRKIFRSFSPSSQCRGQSPCQQGERNASAAAGPKLNVCLLFAALSCPTAAVWGPVLVLHCGNELLRVPAPVCLCGRQAESEFTVKTSEI